MKDLSSVFYLNKKGNANGAGNEFLTTNHTNDTNV